MARRCAHDSAASSSTLLSSSPKRARRLKALSLRTRLNVLRPSAQHTTCRNERQAGGERHAGGGHKAETACLAAIQRAFPSPALTVAVRGQSARSATSPNTSPGFRARSTGDFPSLWGTVTTGRPDTTM